MFQNFLNVVETSENNNELPDVLYFEALKRFAEVQVDVTKIDKVKHVDRVMKPFLVNWGLMSRVVNREEINWETVTTKIRESGELLQPLKGLQLLSMNYSDTKIANSIKSLYNMLGNFKHIGATTRSKMLHLLNPEVFVMWDNAIANSYHKMYNQIDYTAKGYLEFLKTNQTLISETLTNIQKETGKHPDLIVQELSDKYPYCYDKTRKKTLAKFIDEYNWAIAPRP